MVSKRVHTISTQAKWTPRPALSSTSCHVTTNLHIGQGRLLDGSIRIKGRVPSLARLIRL